MSNIYVNEPPTKGKVILNTSYGDLDIELWPKEAPKTCRNFVQLCLDGYYDNTIFHRLIKGFILQGGDPTGTGRGGDSSYGGYFKDEFHTRLRFNRRGLVCMANENKPNTNTSQFFVTLDAAPTLANKHTIFGKVTGDTLFNLLDMGKLEVNDDDRPDVPPVIKSSNVLWNPFDDVVPRTTHLKEAQAEAEAKKKKKKGKKQLNLLSFGDEAEADEETLEAAIGSKGKGVLSSHDVVGDDPRLLRANTAEEEEERARNAAVRASIKGKLKAPGPAREGGEEGPGSSGAGEQAGEGGEGLSFEEKMRAQIMAKRRERGDLPPERGPSSAEASKGAAKPEGRADEDEVEVDYGESDEEGAEAAGAAGGDGADAGRGGSDEEAGDHREGRAAAADPYYRMTKQQKKEARAQKEALKLKRMGLGKLAARVDVDADLVTKGENARRQIKHHKSVRGGREADTLARLARFKTAMSGPGAAAAAPTEADEAAKEEKEVPLNGLYYMEDDDDDDDWKSHSLKFVKRAKSHQDHFAPEADDYVVHDPLLEKGKGKYSKTERAAKKQKLAWAGGSLT